MTDALTLHKVLPALLLPTGIVILLCGYGAWRRQRWPVITGVVFFALAASPVVGNSLLRTLEGSYRHETAEIREMDAVYVLGGYMSGFQREAPEPQWTEAGKRLEVGIRLVLEGRARFLVLSSGGKLEWCEGKRAKAVALERGLREEQVVLTDAVTNTASEANALAALMQERAWRQVAVVTSAFHMRRAMLQMRQNGIAPTPVAADFHARTGSWLLQDLVPQSEALRWTEKALREWMGIGFYTLKGVIL